MFQDELAQAAPTHTAGFGYACLFLPIHEVVVLMLNCEAYYTACLL